MKRAFDIFTLLIALPILLPVFAVVTVLVKLKLGSPVFFRQERGGFKGRPFRIWKFRTMTDTRDQRGELLPDADRLTPFGRYLRATSLDELPSLINVALGQMSLVGPRPFLSQYLPYYSPRQAQRHDVLPGITGWAQISGRNDLRWEQKFELDIWYVDNHTFWLDMRILALTLFKVTSRQGIDHGKGVTMPLFDGQNLDQLPK